MEIKRDRYLKKIISFMWDGQVKVITGIRRCGKSYLLRNLFKSYLLGEGVAEDHILSFELDLTRDIRYRNPLELAAHVREIVEHSADQYYLFVDEIQMSDEVPNPYNPDGKKITFYDALNDLKSLSNLDIYVTGSNSKMLSSDILTEFRGRSDEIRVHPLSFAEYYTAVGGDKQNAFDEFAFYGGMPLILSRPTDTAKMAYLKSLFSEVYLKDIVEEECDLSVRAGVLVERLKSYEPELPKDMEPMVYVNYCEKSEPGNPRCQKLSDLDSKTIEQDKVWYADRDPKTNEPKMTAQMFFTVYYAEKGDKMLHHFQGKIDIGTGNGGIISQLKMQNEMKLTDESWISYQQGKGNEEYQKYMEDLTDMQNHVLPYLQSFCSLEEKGVKERREQQVAEKNESREAVPRTGGEANIAVKDAGKAERKAITGKEKKPSIHERLEINKRIIQEKQGKDEPERGADLSVRMV